jgi:hypothetical protein
LQLFTFASDMMHEVAHSCGHLRGVRALQERFVAFRSQYWFSEVTRRAQGSDLYRTFQRGLEVQSSYDLVTSSVKDVKDYYESVWARKVQLFKDAVTYGGPATMALGAARMIIGDRPHTWTVGGLLALAALLVVFLPVCWRCRLLLLRKWTRRPRARAAAMNRSRPRPLRQEEATVPFSSGASG